MPSLFLSHAPALPIGGVFFPVWILSTLGAIIAALILRAVVIAIARAPVPGLGAPFYAAVAVLIGVGSYRLWIAGIAL